MTRQSIEPLVLFLSFAAKTPVKSTLGKVNGPKGGISPQSAERKAMTSLKWMGINWDATV